MERGERGGEGADPRTHVRLEKGRRTRRGSENKRRHIDGGGEGEERRGASNCLKPEPEPAPSLLTVTHAILTSRIPDHSS